ncbi:MAG: glycine--tRNA ligase subunit beta, partial [Pseudohongiellaceae bacterium]
LVELPVALTGSFDEAFLAVPQEALILAMKSHQKCFHLADAEGRLLPKFVAISNLESKDPQQVITGNERVIRPRLADAQFFFDTD